MTQHADDIRENSTLSEGQPGPVEWGVLEDLMVLQKPGKPDLRRHLMMLYLSSVPPLLDIVKAAINSMDGQALMNSAHSMKSSSMSVGAHIFGNMCAELEQLGRTGSLEDAPALLSRAENEFAAVCSAFRDALEQNG